MILKIPLLLNGMIEGVPAHIHDICVECDLRGGVAFQALGRLADVRMLPMELELENQGWSSLYQWYDCVCKVGVL